MRIDNGDGIQYLRQAYGLSLVRCQEASLSRKGEDETTVASNEAIGLKRDNVSISPLGQELRKVKAAIEANPELREQKVAALREAISNGTYSVSDMQLANKIIQHFLNNE